MANFKKCLDYLFKLEGLGADIKGDPGGETYRGIARNYWGKWEGWLLIDVARKTDGFTPELMAKLDLLAEAFYLVEYWKPIRGDDMPSDPIACEMLEQCVHMNPFRAIEHLQDALNQCNDDQKLWPDIKVDGQLGPITMGVASKACSRRDWLMAVLKDMNVQQAIYYRSRKGRENVYKGWLRRISLPEYL